MKHVGNYSEYAATYQVIHEQLQYVVTETGKYAVAEVDVCGNVAIVAYIAGEREIIAERCDLNSRNYLTEQVSEWVRDHRIYQLPADDGAMGSDMEAKQ